MRLHRIGAAVHLSNSQNPKRPVAVAVAANWQDLRKMSKINHNFHAGEEVEVFGNSRPLAQRDIFQYDFGSS